MNSRTFGVSALFCLIALAGSMLTWAIADLPRQQAEEVLWKEASAEVDVVQAGGTYTVRGVLINGDWRKPVRLNESRMAPVFDAFLEKLREERGPISHSVYETSYFGPMAYKVTVTK